MAGRVEHVGPAPAGEKHVPSALRDRFLLRAPRYDRSPVHHLLVEVHAHLAEHIRADRTFRRQHRQVADRQQHHLLPAVAGRGEIAFDLGVIRRVAEHAQPVRGRERRARRKHTDPGPPHRMIGAGNRGHVIGLAHRLQNHAADRGIVERRQQLVHAQDGDLPGGIDQFDLDLRLGAQGRQIVVGRGLPPVDLAFLQGRGGSRRIRNDLPDHAIEIGDFRTRRPARDTALPRLVAGEFFIHHARPSHPFTGDETIWPAAHHLLDLRERVGLRQPFGHDHRQKGGHLGERVGQQRERLLQTEPDRLVVGRTEFVGRRHQRLGERIALAPPRQAGDAVARQYRRVVVKHQAGAQGDRPVLAIGIGHRALGHLRHRLEGLVLAEQCVEHQEGVVAGDSRGGPDRIQNGQIGLRHKDQLALTGRANDPGGGKRGSGEAAQNGASVKGHAGAFLLHDTAPLAGAGCRQFQQDRRNGNLFLCGAAENGRPIHP